MYDVCCLKYGVVGSGGGEKWREKQTNACFGNASVATERQTDLGTWALRTQETEKRYRTQPPAPATHTVFSAQSQLRRGYQRLDTKLPTEYQFQKATLNGIRFHQSGHLILRLISVLSIVNKETLVSHKR